MASAVPFYVACAHAAERWHPEDAMYAMALEQERVEETPEQRVWKAVIARTIEEWVSGPLRSQREAEEYLFYDEKDFPLVCQSAGMDPGRLRARLSRLRKSSVASAGSRN